MFFFSLDAGQRLAVAAARALLNLPYFSATMRVETDGDRVKYDSARQGTTPAEFRAEYQPAGVPFRPSAGTLEHFLAERYCLYHVTRGGRPYRLEIHHLPWVLQPAEAELTPGGLFTAAGLTPPSAPPLLHFSARQDTLTWGPAPVARPL